MAWKLTAAPSCLLFLALMCLPTEAALPRRTMLNLHAEGSALVKSRFEAGDPVCKRDQFRYECLDVHTPSTQEPPAAFVDDARVLPEDAHPQVPSDCGPLGRHKFRCQPPKKIPINTPAREELSRVAEPSEDPEEAHEPAL